MNISLDRPWYVSQYHSPLPANLSHVGQELKLFVACRTGIEEAAPCCNSYMQKTKALIIGVDADRRIQHLPGIRSPSAPRAAARPTSSPRDVVPMPLTRPGSKFSSTPPSKLTCALQKYPGRRRGKPVTFGGRGEDQSGSWRTVVFRPCGALCWGWRCCRRSIQCVSGSSSC